MSSTLLTVMRLPQQKLEKHADAALLLAQFDQTPKHAGSHRTLIQ